MSNFESRGDKLFIDGKEVIKGWESYSGWYWFATEKVCTQDSDMGDGSIIAGDVIWYGYVQGHDEEWGEFSQGEIESLGKMRVWQIPKKNLPWSGRRN